MKAYGTLHRVLAGAISAVALITGIWNIQKASTADRLRQDHATVSGVITSKTAGMHGMVDYGYAVGGQEYRASGVGGAEREFGAKVTVFYLPSDPSVSLLHDPLVWQSAGWFMVLGPFAVSFFGFCIAAGWTKSGTSDPTKDKA